MEVVYYAMKHQNGNPSTSEKPFVNGEKIGIIENKGYEEFNELGMQ